MFEIDESQRQAQRRRLISEGARAHQPARINIDGYELSAKRTRPGYAGDVYDSRDGDHKVLTADSAGQDDRYQPVLT